jgi:hypothetical protein
VIPREPGLRPEGPFRGPGTANPLEEFEACVSGGEIAGTYLALARGDDPAGRIGGIQGLEGTARDGNLQCYEALRFLLASGELDFAEERIARLAQENVEAGNVLPVAQERLWDGTSSGKALKECAIYGPLAHLTGAMTAVESPDVHAQVHGLAVLEALAMDGSYLARKSVEAIRDAPGDEDVRWLARRASMAIAGAVLDTGVPLPSIQRHTMRILEGRAQDGRNDAISILTRYALESRPLLAAAAEEAGKVLRENGWDR